MRRCEYSRCWNDQVPFWLGSFSPSGLSRQVLSSYILRQAETEQEEGKIKVGSTVEFIQDCGIDIKAGMVGTVVQLGIEGEVAKVFVSFEDEYGYKSTATSFIRISALRLMEE